MKALSMPISSPGRPENFPPPPLKKFMRNNAGGRSKSSRSSPIFYVRGGRNAAGMIEAAQEPYSPKVTCIGQVRARKTGGGARRRRCWFAKRALFWGKFLSRFYSRRRVFRRVLCKWVVFFRTGYCKNVDAEDDCLRKIEFLGGKFENLEIRVGGDGDDSWCSPPRNALMLTRCSRSSSLGERIWRENESRIRQESDGVSENPRINHVRDLMLTRCKSEPAPRTRERVNLEATYTV